MKRFGLLITLLLAFSMVLAACADADVEETPFGEMEGTPGPIDEGIVTETPFLEETPVETEVVVETPVETPVETEVVATEPILEETEVVTETPVTGDILPLTGATDPSRVSNLLDFTIIDANGEEIGEVHDMIINLDTSQLEYLVVEIGGFLGLGENAVAIPWRGFEYVPAEETDPGLEEGSLRIDVTEEALENAPEFDEGQFDADIDEGTIDVDWDRDHREYWSTELGITFDDDVVEAQIANGFVLADDLLGYDLENAAGEEWGEVVDAVVDIQSGEVRYLLVDTEGLYEDDADLLPVPLSHLRFDHPSDLTILDVEQEVLVDAPRFRIDDWLEMELAEWEAEANQFWSSIEASIEGTGNGS